MRKPLLIAGGIALIALAAFAVVWFEPQKLFIDDKVDEAATMSGRSVATGRFQSKEHATTGRASVIEGRDGSRTLRIEDLDTSNGPDLRVYLSTAHADADWKSFDDDFVELGKLKGNKGDQNYSLPSGVDISEHGRVVIWCKRFSVPFGVAPLSAAAETASG